MHRALYIPEISSEISRACLDGSYDLDSNLRDGEGRSALFALARTCRALLNPALDALWGYQHGLVNLIRCMPSDLWEEYCNWEVDGAYESSQWTTTHLTFTREPAVNDWDRFDYYARRVHVLDYDEALQWMDVAEDVYLALGAHVSSISSPLFPALQSLHWEADTFFPFISLFLTPSLLSLRMSTISSETSLVHILNSLPSTCPFLRKLESYIGSSSTMPPPSLSCWTEFKDVRGFSPSFAQTSDPLDWLPRLSELRYLQAISLSVFQVPLHNESPNPIILFPSVKHLTIFADSIAQCVRVFDSCHFDSLRNITINSYTGIPISLQHLSRTLSQSIHRASLQSLALYEYSDRITEGADHIEFTALDPLFIFSELRQLRLDSRCAVHLSDDSLRLVARAWPHLESFVLNWIGHHTREQALRMITPSLGGLAHLASRCLDLSTLAVAMATPKAKGDHLLATSLQSESAPYSFEGSAIASAERSPSVST